MPIYVGADLMTRRYVGADEVDRVYVGADLVYSAASRVRGITQGAYGRDRPRLASAPAIPSAGTWLIEGIGIAGEEPGSIGSYGRNAAGPNRFIITPQVEAGKIQTIIHGGSSGTTYVGPAVSGVLDGSTRWMVAIRYTGTSMQQTLLGGTLSTTSHTISSPAHGTSLEVQVFDRLLVSQRFAGTLEQAFLPSDLTDANLLAIFAAGSLEAAGVFSGTYGTPLWSMYSVDGQTLGDPITVGSQIAAGTWSLVAGSARLTVGGL